MDYGLVGVSRLTVPNAQSVGLVVGAVGTRYNFFVLVGAGNPGFEVIFLRSHGAHVTRANVHNFVVDSEAVPQIRAVLEQLLVQGPGILGLGDDDLFNLGKLVNPPNSEVALAVACLLYTSPSPRDGLLSRMPSSA